MTQIAHSQVGPARPDGTQPITAAGPLLTRNDIAFLVATAARAPSVHNTQPWKFHADGAVIELFADADRQLHQVDPAGRELMISCGAALFGLRLGLRKLGHVPAVELLPDPAQSWLVARVGLDGRVPMSREEAELLAAIPHRHTHRGPFTLGEMPARLQAALQADASAEGCELRLVEDHAMVRGLAELVSAAAEEQRASPWITAELAQWVQPPGSQAREGVPASARPRLSAAGAVPDAGGAPGGVTGPMRLPQRDFGRVGTERSGGEPPSATAVLVTAGDAVVDWLRAGQGLHRLLLRAATRWVFASLQSQPLESARHRTMVADRLSLSGYPQLILQFGRANTALATARRPQAELRTNDEPG